MATSQRRGKAARTRKQKVALSPEQAAYKLLSEARERWGACIDFHQAWELNDAAGHAEYIELMNSIRGRQATRPALGRHLTDAEYEALTSSQQEFDARRKARDGKRREKRVKAFAILAAKHTSWQPSEIKQHIASPSNVRGVLCEARKATQTEGDLSSVDEQLTGAKAVYLGSCKIQIGSVLLALGEGQGNVVEAIVDLRTATKCELEQKSGYNDAVRILRRLVQQHAILKPFIKFPGRKGGGGYSTSIIANKRRK